MDKIKHVVEQFDLYFLNFPTSKKLLSDPGRVRIVVDDVA